MATEGKRGCLAALFGQGASSSKPGTAAPEVASPIFRLRADFLSATELSFFRALEVATRDRFLVFPKVNMADLFYSPTRNMGDWNRINRKHADFVLWDLGTLRPVLAIELDDSSHAGARATKRDAVKDAAFASAGLALLRLPARGSYVVEEIRTSIDAAIAAGTTLGTADDGAEMPDGAPVCPQCGIPMVVRESARGRFNGCSNYPRCRERKSMPSN